MASTTLTAGCPGGLGAPQEPPRQRPKTKSRLIGWYFVLEPRFLQPNEVRYRPVVPSSRGLVDTAPVDFGR